MFLFFLHLIWFLFFFLVFPSIPFFFIGWVFPFSFSAWFLWHYLFLFRFGLGSLFNFLRGIYFIWIRIQFLAILVSNPCSIK
jgi:hypothetical protein